MNIYDPTFTSAQVAKAAGMTATNFRAHLARGNWRIIGDSVPAEKFGSGHLFTIYDVLGYALAAELIQCGLDPKAAFERAMYDFAHTGGQEWQPNGKVIDREPGGVFQPEANGHTLFVYVRGADRGKCVAANAITNGAELLIAPNMGIGTSAIVVGINGLRDRVFAALGLDARDHY